MAARQKETNKEWKKEWKKHFRKKSLYAASLGLLLNFLSLSYNASYNLVDFLYTRFGFPFQWLAHANSPIPILANRWNFFITEFLLNWLFWFVVSLMILLILYKRKILKK